MLLVVEEEEEDGILGTDELPVEDHVRINNKIYRLRAQLLS